MIAIGLICGTSLDGIDAALVDMVPAGEGYAVRLLAARTHPFAGDVAARLRAAVAPGRPEPAEVAALDLAVGASFAEAAAAVAGSARIDFVASHGVTLYHAGDRCITWQIGNPFAIRERVGTTVLFDFRRADCAAGGSGAPLVPYADALWFGSRERFRVAINLGGIANATMLPPGASFADARAWDIGPGNMLIDAFVRSRTGGSLTCDRDGAYAAHGTVDAAALRTLLDDPYFALPPPKTAGREQFGDAFWKGRGAVLEALSLHDGCATLVALTAETIAATIRATGARAGDAVVAGGGVHNPALMRALAERLAGFDVLSSARFGVDPDMKEAMAFALLGYELVRGRPCGLPAVTGARHAALLGAIVPQDLDRLVALVREELDATAKQEARSAVRR
jgi:anhydro-N-acetylmuramic acid kinase